MFTIRPAVATDEPFLFEMLYEALFVPPGTEPFPSSILEAPDIAHYAAGFGTRDGDVGLVAQVDSRPIGAAWVRRLSSDDPGYGYIDDETPELTISVVEEWRGKGVGTELLERLLRTVPRMSLSCDRRNEAMRLYRWLGFGPVDTSGDSVTLLWERHGR